MRLGDSGADVSRVVIGLLAAASLCAPTDAALAQGTAATDRAALVALYNATDGPNWTNNTNWLTDAPLSDWFGVTTDGSNRVVGLRLGGWENDAPVSNGLTGSIPGELGSLDQLRSLNLCGNQLTGSIPRELGNLANLERLDLCGNRLTGSIPLALGNLARLRELHLWVNQLSGPIPPELGNLSNLQSLWVPSNQLTGSIPPSWAD